MRKLRLELDALEVESFEVERATGAGTVRGMSYDTGCGCPDTGPRCPAPPASEYPNNNTACGGAACTVTVVGTCCSPV